MARASITYRWPDGSALMCEIRLDASFPDAIDEAKAQAVALLREAWGLLPAEDDPAT